MVATEHPDIAEPLHRIDFCNKVASVVNNIKNSKPTTIISLCAGGLLPDQMRHNQLSEKKRHSTGYVACDPKYNTNLSKKDDFETNLKARQHFKQDKTEARAFSTFTAYADKKIEGRRLLDVHKKGNIVGIFEDPTSFIPGQMENLSQDLRDNGLIMRGKVIPETDIDKANSIYVTVAADDANGRAVVNGIANSIETGIGFTTSTLKCFPEPDGQISFQAGGHVPEKFIRFIKQETRGDASSQSPGETPIKRLKRMLDKVKQDIEAANSPFLVGLVPVNDLDRVKQEFVQQCSDADGQVYLATFENNNIDIETLKS